MEHFSKIVDILKPLGHITKTTSGIIIEHDFIKLMHFIKNGLVTVSCDNITSYHILRLIFKKLITSDNIWIDEYIQIPNEQLDKYILILNELLETNFYNYCTICGIPHDKSGLSYITTCTNDNCIKKSYHYPISNKITDFNKSDKSSLLLLVRTMFSAFNHSKVDKIFKPIPTLYSFSDIKNIIGVIPEKFLKNDFEELISQIDESFDDFYLWKKINNNIVYALLINCVSDNYYSMNSYQDLVTFDLKKKIINKIDDKTNEVGDIEFFNIVYSTEIENDINAKLDHELKYYYLYHGSPFHCWYSIIKNGLKVMSGTEFMTTGAAYGHGVYLSDKIEVSMGYVGHCSPFNYSMIGLFQIIENPKKHLKAPSIYVVDNDKMLILRTLIKFNKTFRSGNIYKQLNDYFIRERTMEKHVVNDSIKAVKNKRLNAEIKFIEKSPDKYTILSCSDENDKPWVIELKINSSKYKVNVFFHNYPVLPPLIKIIDFNKPIKGIIEKDFKFNIPILETSNWKISTKLIDVLNIISSFIECNY